MTNSLPDNLYTCEQTRELDRLCTQQYGLEGIVLMKRAARAAFEYGHALWPHQSVSDDGAWIVLCGAGNNAGDGYIFAALAAQRRQKVEVYYVSDPNQLKGDAYSAYVFAKQEGVVIAPFEAQAVSLNEDVVIVDALLGTGLAGCVRQEYLDVITWANNSLRPILSLDIPSGLCGDTGAVQGVAIKAFATITFIGCKVGLLTGCGPAMVGQLSFNDLGVAPDVYEKIENPIQRLDYSACAVSSVREKNAHKGDFGHLMVVGGDYGYGGAAIMAAESAAYTGAGMVSLATRAEHVAPALTRRPELMVMGVASGQEIEPLLTRPSLLVVGPGLGLSPWSEQMLQQAIASALPMVVDADALSILAQGRLCLPVSGMPVFTPHPGEAARMLACSIEEVQRDRVATVKQLQSKYGGVVVLKGAGTLIFDGSTLVLANVGNAGLATAGSGDVLSGIIGACMAQGMAAFDAAKYGVCVHGAAADRAVEKTGEKGLFASELMPYVRELMS